MLPVETIHLAESQAAFPVTYEGWPTIGEVMQRTGLSERSVYRSVSAGRLRTAQQPIPKRKPLTVYNPADVEAIIRAGALLHSEKLSVMLPAAEREVAVRQNTPPSEFWQALIEAVRPQPAALPPAAESDLPPLAELRQKLIVTRAEAKRLGFTARILAAVEKFPGGRYKMRDLEAL